MKKIFLLFLVCTLWACSSSNDETTQPDPTDDMGGDPNDEGTSTVTVDFDVAIIARDNDFNYFQIEIENGSNVLPAEPILQEVDPKSSFARRLEDDTYYVYSPFNVPDFKVERRNVLTGVENTYVDFIDPNLPEMAHNILPGRDHIVTFYTQQGTNNEPEVNFNLYSVGSGTYEQVFISNENLGLIKEIREGWLVTSFVDDQAELFLRIFNLNNTSQQYTVGPANDYLPITVANGKVYTFGNNKYRILDLNTGVWGNDITTTDFIRADYVFKSRIIGNKMYYDALNVQPNAFVSSPAIFDFSTGTNTTFDLGQFKQDWWAASGNQILESTATAIQEDDEILVLSFSYRTSNNIDTYGILFVTYDFEVVSFLEIPHLPLELVIK